MRAYSVDLRQKADAHNQHRVAATTGKRFRVSLTFIESLKRYRTDGTVESTAWGGRSAR